MKLAPEALLDAHPTLEIDDSKPFHAIDLNQIGRNLERIIQNSLVFRTGEWSRRTRFGQKHQCGKVSNRYNAGRALSNT